MFSLFPQLSTGNFYSSERILTSWNLLVHLFFVWTLLMGYSTPGARLHVFPALTAAGAGNLSVPCKRVYQYIC